MVPAAGRSQAGRVPRLVILWTRPHHLSRAEAETWVRDRVPELGARVTEVRSAADTHPAAWHWMLELDVPDDAAAGRSLQRGPIADWVGDLHLLGMRPTVLLVDAPGAAA
jgi:hypothetical protein